MCVFFGSYIIRIYDPKLLKTFGLLDFDIIIGPLFKKTSNYILHTSSVNLLWGLTLTIELVRSSLCWLKHILFTENVHLRYRQ